MPVILCISRYIPEQGVLVQCLLRFGFFFFFWFSTQAAKKKHRGQFAIEI